MLNLYIPTSSATAQGWNRALCCEPQWVESSGVFIWFASLRSCPYDTNCSNYYALTIA